MRVQIRHNKQMDEANIIYKDAFEKGGVTIEQVLGDEELDVGYEQCDLKKIRKEILKTDEQCTGCDFGFGLIDIHPEFEDINRIIATTRNVPLHARTKLIFEYYLKEFVEKQIIHDKSYLPWSMESIELHLEDHLNNFDEYIAAEKMKCKIRQKLAENEFAQVKIGSKKIKLDVEKHKIIEANIKLWLLLDQKKGR
jgi:hypothetical protein